MAFSTTVRGQLGLGGGLRVIWGEWTGSSGDSAGTLALAGGFPVMAVFQKFDPIDKTYDIVPRIEISVSSGICTYTIENQDDVTTGRFFIVHGGN